MYALGLTLFFLKGAGEFAEKLKFMVLEVLVIFGLPMLIFYQITPVLYHILNKGQGECRFFFAKNAGLIRR